MNLSIERATAADAEALVRAQIAAFHSDAEIYPGVEIGGPPGYDSVNEMRAKIEQDETYKIVCDGQCIGGIVVFDRGQGHYHLDVIFVDPAFHNRGIGSQAMQFLERTYPARLWTLDTPQYAVRNQHFYEKFGYVKVRAYELDGFPLYGYEKAGN
ncbi:MAG: GNAT family N-acetyltransferase [Chloroflexi bacterium]|nr:GNAT family N-acetyltransferase [Chloroflexota bacterium]